jgi:hypothetical protein
MYYACSNESHRATYSLCQSQQLRDKYPQLTEFRFPHKSVFNTFSEFTKKRRMTGFQDLFQILVRHTSSQWHYTCRHIDVQACMMMHVNTHTTERAHLPICTKRVYISHIYKCKQIPLSPRPVEVDEFLGIDDHLITGTGTGFGTTRGGESEAEGNLRENSTLQEAPVAETGLKKKRFTYTSSSNAAIPSIVLSSFFTTALLVCDQCMACSRCILRYPCTRANLRRTHAWCNPAHTMNIPLCDKRL